MVSSSRHLNSALGDAARVSPNLRPGVADRATQGPKCCQLFAAHRPRFRVHKPNHTLRARRSGQRTPVLDKRPRRHGARQLELVPALIVLTVSTGRKRRVQERVCVGSYRCAEHHSEDERGLVDKMRLDVAPPLAAERMLRRGMPVDLDQPMSDAIHINPSVTSFHVNLRAPIAPRAVINLDICICHDRRRLSFIHAGPQLYGRLFGATLAHTAPRTRPLIRPRIEACRTGGVLELIQEKDVRRKKKSSTMVGTQIFGGDAVRARTRPFTACQSATQV